MTEVNCSNMSIPTTLTLEQAEELTSLLRQAQVQLSDAAGYRDLVPHYVPTSVRIAEALRDLGVEPD